LRNRSPNPYIPAMRLDQKYFIPFMLIVAGICLVLILYFNIRHLDSQQQRFAERVGDGSVHLEQAFPAWFSDDEVRVADFTGDGPLILFFWSTWSQRASQAQQHLYELYESAERRPVIVSAAVKDNEEHVREEAERYGYPFLFVNGTEHYNEVRLPGLPSLIAWNPDGTLYGARLGFTGTADYDFLNSLLNPDS
jgi:hypothetical protein